MRRIAQGITVSAALALLTSTAGAQGAKALKKCSVDAVVSGTVCVDNGSNAGPLTVNGFVGASDPNDNVGIGFRCAR